MRQIALYSIRLYQRYLSPYKGFSCAYRCATSRASCSQLGYRAIRRFGFLKGVGVLESRTHKCGVASRRMLNSRYGRTIYQRGECDVGCDLPGTCDFGSLDCDFFKSRSLNPFLDCAGTFADCGSCDWSSRKKKQEDDKYVYIPPNVSHNVSVASSNLDQEILK
jgi:uncharacterized protein